MADNKLIKISSTDWHYRLIKYCWGIEPSIYRNLCPYFWLTIASLFTFVPVCVFKTLYNIFNFIISGVRTCFKKASERFDNRLDKLSKKWFKDPYERAIRDLTRGQIYYIYALRNGLNVYEGCYIDHFFETARKLQRTYGINLSMIMDDITKFTGVNEDDASNYIDYYKREIAYFRVVGNSKRAPKKLVVTKEVLDKAFKDKEIDDKRKEKLEKLTKHVSCYTEIVVKFWILLFLVFGVFLIENLVSKILSWVFITFTGGDFLIALSWLACVLLCIGSVIVTSEFFDYIRNLVKNRDAFGGTKGFFGNVIYTLSVSIAPVFSCVFKYLVYYPIYKFAYRTVIIGILSGFAEGFNEFGGIFSDYFNASYSDYCPGIEWEKNEEGND